MRRFVLQPYKMRGSRFAPQKDTAPVEFDWPQLRERLVPSKLGGVRLNQALNNLRGMRPNSFIGTVTSAKDGETISFYFCNTDATDPDADWVVSRDPSFPSRIVEVFRVVEAEWGIEFHEAERAAQGRVAAMQAL